MGLEDRLRRLEARSGAPDDTAEYRERIRQEAERLNEARWREGREHVFEITENGDVLCTHDGKPVTSYHQTLAEDWYWRHVEWSVEEHDEEAQAFYTPGGELALSRTYCNLARVFRCL